MGLDMYLSAERYLGAWEHYTPEDRTRALEIADAVGLADALESQSPSVYVKVVVGYWRKANAIHDFFVRECQGGRDECEESDVAPSQLIDLRHRCDQILTLWRSAPYAAKALATELLPTRSGFFFGGTDLDEHYQQDLRDTIEIVDKCLALSDKLNGDLSFYYRSSW